MLPDVGAEGVCVLLEPLGDVRFDLLHAPLDGLVLQMGFVAAVQRGSHGVVGAFIRAAEVQQLRESGDQGLGKRQPPLDLETGVRVGGDRGEQIVLDRAGWLQVAHQLGERGLQQALQVPQAGLGGLPAEILPARVLIHACAPADPDLLVQAGTPLSRIEGEMPLHPRLFAALAAERAVRHVGTVLSRQAVRTEKKAQRHQHGALTAVVVADQDGRTADGDVLHSGQRAESTGRKAVQVHCGAAPNLLCPASGQQG